MSLSLSLGPRQRITQKISHALTLGQRHAIRVAFLATRSALIGWVHGGAYNPKAVCPGCSHHLEPLEIIDGFRADPNDYTTACPKCKVRFNPQLVWRASDISSAELPFYCSMQVLAQLDGLEGKTADVIQKEHPAIYHAAIFHHGNLRKAFERAGKQYTFQNVPDWQDKVKDYLGRLPDTVIADVVDVPARAVSKLRKSQSIPPFNRRALAEAEE